MEPIDPKPEHELTGESHEAATSEPAALVPALEGASAIGGTLPVEAGPETAGETPAEAAPDTQNDAGKNDAAAKVVHRESGESWWEVARSLLVVLVAVLGVRTFVGEATVIPTGSMESTILIGDHVFLNKLLYGPEVPYTHWRLPVIRPIHRGDIVAFRYPRDPSVMYVKRVIALGGDVVKIVDKKVYVNGKPLFEPYTQFYLAADMPLLGDFPPTPDEVQRIPAYTGLNSDWAHEMPMYIRDDGLHVPQDAFFAMGDNRDNSADSRFWGFVPIENIVGEPLFVYWSYDAPTRDWTAETISDRLRFDVSIARNFLAKTRWSRMGKVF